MNYQIILDKEKLMILHSQDWFDGIRLEVVNGDDIMESYRNNSKVSSCMSNEDRWKRTKFYSFITKLSMVRAMRDDVLMLRTLLWEAVDIATGEVIKTLDTIYAKSYPFDYCDSSFQHLSHPDILTKFTDIWQEFANVKKSSRRLTVDVEQHKLDEYPCADTFKYLSAERDKASNCYIRGGYTITDHVRGTL